MFQKHFVYIGKLFHSSVTGNRMNKALYAMLSDTQGLDKQEKY